MERQYKSTEMQGTARKTIEKTRKNNSNSNETITVKGTPSEKQDKT